MASNLVKLIKEGQAQLTVPKSVFYNPVQEFNRDLSVFVLKAYLKHNVWHHKNEEYHVTSRGGMKILDALSASGLRSIRYAKELGPSGAVVKNIVANDISEAAFKIIKQNIESNNVQHIVTPSLSDAAINLFNSSANFEDRYHVIDLDPFGTGSQFFNAAVKSIGEAGLLMVTCTDTAVLCGNAAESCFARYGATSVRSEFCHEVALRIILRSLESHAAVYGRYIKPLISVSVDFYVRLFVQVFTHKAETKKSSSKVSQIYLCKQCRTPQLQPLGGYKLKEDSKQSESDNLAVKYKFKAADVKVGDKCPICKGSMLIAGPIWTEPIHDKKFLDILKQELDIPEAKDQFKTFRRIEGMVHICSEELDVPLFYPVPIMASVLQMKMPKRLELLSALANAGYKTSDCQTNHKGFKTDAPCEIVWDIFSQLAEANASFHTDDEVASNILARPERKKDFNFAINEEIIPESRKRSLLRYQQNPTPNWGPGHRPVAEPPSCGDKSLDDDEDSLRKKLKLEECEERPKGENSCNGEQQQE